MTLKKWQREYRDRLMALNDEDLFNEMLDAQMPDDWDGAFTDQGRWHANESVRQVHDKYARNARLGPLVTEELASMLERLAYLARPHGYAAKDARNYAARIREALALEGDDE